MAADFQIPVCFHIFHNGGVKKVCVQLIWENNTIKAAIFDTTEDDRL